MTLLLVATSTLPPLLDHTVLWRMQGIRKRVAFNIIWMVEHRPMPFGFTLFSYW